MFGSYEASSYDSPTYVAATYSASDVLPISTITLTQLAPSFVVSTVNLTFTNGLSEPITMPGTNLAAFITDSAIVGDSWAINATSLPSMDLVQVVKALTQAGDAAIQALFGSDNTEPYMTLRTLWRLSPDLPISLGVAALALAYRTNDLRS